MSELERALLEHGRLAPEAPASGRPRVALNMVATVDGRTTVEGRVGDLTSPADQSLLRYLRSQADAVLVGANTVREEGYATLRSDFPAGAEARAWETRVGQPLLCIVTRRLALPPELPVLQNPDLHVLVITTSDGEIPAMPARVEYLRAPGGGPVSLRWALEELHEKRGIRRVVCEGGPTLNAHLFEEGSVDDLFLTVSPRVLGDEAALTLLSGSLSAPIDLSLRSHVVEGDFMFLRYQVS